MKTHELHSRRSKTAFLLLAFGLASSANAAAQGMPFEPPQMISNGKSVYWSSELGPGKFNRMEAANLAPLSMCSVLTRNAHWSA